MSITNSGAEPAIFSLQAHVWQQQDDGDPRLSDTDAIRGRPQTVELQPGEAASVEVLSDADLGEGEHAFRISVGVKSGFPHMRGMSGF